MHELLNSTAVAFVGRKNSGKTTVVCGVIERLSARGLDVGSIKHHGHCGFTIDIPGKDSFRHRESGATETVIAAPDVIARIASVEGEVECSRILETMPGHDIVIVEGYRESGLACIEVMRAGNEADERAAQAWGEEAPAPPDVRVPGPATVAVLTDIPAAAARAEEKGMPVFDLLDENDAGYTASIETLCDFVVKFARPRVTVAIQAGGESKRMGESKALVEFNGRPLIVRMVERLLPVADELLITTNEADKLTFLHDVFPFAGIRLVPDIYEQRGALAGLSTALEAASNDYVAVVACDMVMASPQLVVAQVDDMVAHHPAAVVPRNSHGFEPFHAVYDKRLCAPIAAESVGRGSQRVRDLLDRVEVLEFSQERVWETTPSGGCFANANTPEELEKLQRAATSR